MNFSSKNVFLCVFFSVCLQGCGEFEFTTKKENKESTNVSQNSADETAEVPKPSASPSSEKTQDDPIVSSAVTTFDKFNDLVMPIHLAVADAGSIKVISSQELLNEFTNIRDLFFNKPKSSGDSTSRLNKECMGKNLENSAEILGGQDKFTMFVDLTQFNCAGLKEFSAKSKTEYLVNGSDLG